MLLKPSKKSTKKLFREIEKAIQNGDYYFTEHGEQRSLSRVTVNDEEIVRILESPSKWHEKNRDSYEKGRADWNYHIRGKNSDEERIRIAISFDNDGMLIITVINLDQE